MADSEVSNATITDAWLGIDDHGMSSFIMLDYGGSGQGFGGYSLTGEAMYLWVKRVLEVVGVSKWHELKGKPVRAEHSWGGVSRLGNYIKDEWFQPELEFQHLNKVAV